MNQILYPDLNRDIDRREQIIFGNEKYDDEKYPGGIRYFHDMSYDTLKKLVEENFVNVDDKQNDAPSIKELMEYAENHQHMTFNGYAVELARPDYRISIDAISQDFGKDKDVKTAMAEFSNHFSAADDFQIDNSAGYAWWD